MSLKFFVSKEVFVVSNVLCLLPLTVTSLSDGTIWSLVHPFFLLNIHHPTLWALSGRDLRDGDPPNEVPRVAAVRLVPGAGVRLQASDGGHAGGEALCHRGGGGPFDRDVCQ